MKQKIILKVQMPCDKCRTKAMTTAAAIQGVNEVALQGAEKDQLMVIGEVDPVMLACSLRKKLHNATIVSVEEKKEEKKDEKEKEKTDEQAPYVHYPQYFIVGEALAQDPYQATVCSIM